MSQVKYHGAVNLIVTNEHSPTQGNTKMNKLAAFIIIMVIFGAISSSFATDTIVIGNALIDNRIAQIEAAANY